MYMRNDILTEKRLAHLYEIRCAEREARFAALIPAIGEEAARELNEVYKLFTTDMLIWYAGLWEPEIGGFYFSNSARDTEGLLPDLESTAQAMRFLTGHCCMNFPERFRRQMADFAWNLQDEDGYFYHPQWGKDITVTRRGRDLGWAKQLIALTGREYRYPLPTARKADGGATSLPDYLQSVEAWDAYLESKPLNEKSYSIGNLINSLAGQIQGAGPEFCAATVAWANRHQRSDNGLWEPQINYSSVNGLMKLAACYPGFGAVLPNADKALDSAMKAVLSDEKITFACEFFNPWSAISSILRCMEMGGETEKAVSLRASFRENAAELIRVTGRKIRTTACEDGSFAYFAADAGQVCTRSQGALVAQDHVREGDVNGNGCSINGPLNGMFASLGVPSVPLFTKEDGELLIELMDARVPAEKTLSLPEELRMTLKTPRM